MIGLPDDGPESEARKGVQQFHTSVAFGTSFITLMFLGFALGFYLGKYIFQLKDVHCYVLSIIVGVSTMILETVLYIIKVEKIEGDERKKEVKTSLHKLD